MATDPEDSVIARINAMGAWTENTNLFKGPLRPVGTLIPQTAAFVLYTGGPSPMNLAPNSGTLQEYEHAVQVLVRGEAEQYGPTQALAQAVYTQLHDQAISGYYAVRAVQSTVSLVDKDERGSFVFVINLRLRILE